MARLKSRKIFVINKYGNATGGGMVIQNYFVETIQLAEKESIIELVNLKSPLNTFIFILKRNIEYIFNSRRDLLIFQGVYSLHFILFDLFLINGIKSIIVPRGDYIPHKSDIWKVPSRILKTIYWYLFIRWRIQSTNLLVFNSEIELKRYQRMNVLLNNVQVIPDSINLERRFLEQKNDNKIEIDTFDYLLYVGRISPEKNIEFLFDVLFKLQTTYNLKNIKLIIVGPINKPKYFNLLSDKIKKMNLGNSVIFKFSTNTSELTHLYRNCKAVMLPSHVESFGLTVLESTYFGKNIIVSDLTPWTGFENDLIHVCKMDANLWVDIILSLQSESPNKENISKFLNMFRTEKVSEKWKNVINEI